MLKYLKFVVIIISIFTFSCQEKVKEEAPQVYTGPLSRLLEATIVFSDSAKQKAVVEAKELLDLQNGDQEVPQGMFITFFKKNGSISATLRANYAYYYKEEGRWKATGNVIVNNIENQETLKSEELFWEPKNEDVYTDKFVRIETSGELMTGTGLKAKQDFSEWTLANPEGIIDIEENGS